MAARRDCKVPYSVPKRFGTRTVLALTTCFGFLLVASEWTTVPAVVLVFYASCFVFVYVGQMVFHRAPRAASILAGALFMPLAVYGSFALPLGEEALAEQILPRLTASHRLAWLIAIGGFLGYLSGTVMASIFMVADQIGRVLARGRRLVGMNAVLDDSSCQAVLGHPAWDEGSGTGPGGTPDRRAEKRPGTGERT